MLPTSAPGLTKSLPCRVAYIHDANVYGGMEILQLNMLRHLDSSRFEPFIVIPGYDDDHRSSPEQFINQLQQTGVPILQPPHPGDIPLVSVARDVRNIAHLLRQARIDIAHIQTRHPSAARRVTLAARLAGVKGLVRTEHLPPSHHFNAATRYTTALFDLMTDYIVTDSESNREEQIRLLKRPTSKVRRSYCGIDAFAFNPQHNVRAAKARLGFDADLPVIGAIGRLHEQKGHTYLIEAAAQVLAARGPVQFVIVGDGPLMADLQAQARRLGVDKALRFAGFQSDYVRYMEAMDIAVMPSLWEGFSISMQEFMAIGKPLVVTDHASFREAITHERHGLIVPARDAGALAQALQRLLNAPALAARLAEAAVGRVREEFSIQRHMSDLMELYDTLLYRGPLPEAA